jgi:predicted nucleic acid-binding protein
MSSVTVIYDACVLYPAPLRDLLMETALTDLYKAKWTNEIHDEWIRNCLADRPDLQRERLERTRDLMNMHVRDSLVDGYQDLIVGLTLPDPKDRHVLAAAIKCGANAIITFNLRDFPNSILSKYNIEAQHPDDFLFNQLSLNGYLIRKAVSTVWERLKKPPYTKEEYLDILHKQQLPKFVSLLRESWLS